MASDSSEKSDLQEREYDFPYHHLPYLTPRGFAVRYRAMAWGFEYLCYLAHVRELVHSLAPDSCLDVGCGDGRLLGLLGPRVPRRAGADLSERAVAHARAFHPDVEFHVADPADVPGVFDVVTAIEVLEHIPDGDTGRFLRELARHARPGGHVVLSVPTVAVPRAPKHHRHYDEQLLRRQVQESGAVLSFARVEHVCRRSALVDWYVKLGLTRFWFVDIRPLSYAAWRYTWKKLRHADARTGTHLVALLRKEE